MYQRIHESVSVKLNFNSNPAFVTPESIVWRGREYRVKKLGLHHIYKSGKTLFHVFSVASETLFMRLVLNTDTLFWKLEEIWDSEATVW